MSNCSAHTAHAASPGADYERKRRQAWSQRTGTIRFFLAAVKPPVAQIGSWPAYGAPTQSNFFLLIVLTADEKGAIIALKFRTDHRSASVLRR
jgi:hypothetical protein